LIVAPMPRPRKVSQFQLAQELGVSQALVSLVLNGRKSGINADTYERIWAHAIKRGYHPKGMHLASSPATTQPRQVGYILRAPFRLNTLGFYFNNVQHGLHTALEEHGLTTAFLGSEDQLDTERLHQLLPAGHHYQGVVLLGEVARPFLDELRKVERRIVAVSARFTGLCHSVLGNEPAALEQLVRHLYELGHRRFGWLGGNAGLGRHEARYSALKAALAQAGLTLDARYVIALPEADRAEGTEATHRLLPLARQKDFPTALLCYNCLMADGAARAFAHAGWRIPADLSIAGADAQRPPTGAEPLVVTAAGTDPVKLGEAAARLVLASTGAEDESFNDLMLPSQLIVGETTGPVKT
jgi:LacI family transcriptional regulator